MVMVHEVLQTNVPPQEFQIKTPNMDTLIAISNTAIFRHGETKMNKEELLQGSSDGEETLLTKRGISQTTMVSQELLKFTRVPSRILVSPLLRTRHTARILGENIPGVLHTVRPEFLEYSFGDWEGLHIIDNLLKGAESEYHDMFVTNPFEASEMGFPPNGENFYVFARRVQRAMKIIEHYEKDESIMIVTHAMFLRMMRFIILLMKKFPGQEISDEMMKTNGSYFFWNDGISHQRDDRTISEQFRIKPPNGKITNDFLLLNDLKAS